MPWWQMKTWTPISLVYSSFHLHSLSGYVGRWHLETIFLPFLASQMNRSAFLSNQQERWHYYYYSIYLNITMPDWHSKEQHWNYMSIAYLNSVTGSRLVTWKSPCCPQVWTTKQKQSNLWIELVWNSNVTHNNRHWQY